MFFLILSFCFFGQTSGLDHHLPSTSKLRWSLTLLIRRGKEFFVCILALIAFSISTLRDGEQAHTRRNKMEDEGEEDDIEEKDTRIRFPSVKESIRDRRQVSSFIVDYFIYIQFACMHVELREKREEA